MPIELTTERVWEELKKGHFAVLATVNRKGEPRSAGIVYMVRNREFFIATGRSSLKARNIQANPCVSMTVTLKRRILLLPWLRIPPAVITFSGGAILLGPNEVPPEAHKKLVAPLKMSEAASADLCYLRIQPVGNFTTYGVGVSLRTMLRPEEASGRVPVRERAAGNGS